LLEQGFVLQDLKRFRELPHFLQTERIYKDYPAWLNRVASQVFNIDLSPRKKIFKLLTKERPKGLNFLKVIGDILKGWRGL